MQMACCILGAIWYIEYRLILQRHFYRHARGHPEPQLYLKTNWIPAFAGMTIEINI